MEKKSRVIEEEEPRENLVMTIPLGDKEEAKEEAKERPAGKVVSEQEAEKKARENKVKEKEQFKVANVGALAALAAKYKAS